jgi:protein ImuB
MARLACANILALPLQILLRGHPDWADAPMAVLDRDHPGGRVLYVSRRARAARVRPGMRYAAALSLAPDLRAAPVEAHEIEQAVQKLVEVLRGLTPSVEPHPMRPGIFWLDAAGLGRIHRTDREWGAAVLRAIDAAGFRAVFVLGYTRFGTWAISGVVRGLQIIPSLDEERTRLGAVPVDRIGLPAEAVDTLHRFGVRTVAGFVDLTAADVASRLGHDAARLHALATSADALPVQATLDAEPIGDLRILDRPVSDAAGLLFLIRERLVELVATAEQRSARTQSIELKFRLDDRRNTHFTVSPATPSNDDEVLCDLISLRLSTLPLSAGVVEIGLELRVVPVEHGQVLLSLERPRRDFDAASRALARLRAELGENAVGVLRLSDGHLPEARWKWVPSVTVRPPRVAAAPSPMLTRRVLLKPRPLAPRERHEPDGWLVAGLEAGPVVRQSGPYIVAGGWWNREIHREYHYVETRRGDLLWVYWDRRRRVWFLHGTVE